MTVPYDAIVSQLQTMGFSPEKAAAAAREVHPELAKAMDRNAIRRADVSEKAEQAIIVKMARAVGMHVYNLSQARATKQTPGLYDLWMTHQAQHFAGWFDAKRQVGGQLSGAQREFAEECNAAGIPFGSGDRYAFASWLRANGFTPPHIPA